jgi:hypothetical protein
VSDYAINGDSHHDPIETPLSQQFAELHERITERLNEIETDTEGTS